MWIYADRVCASKTVQNLLLNGGLAVPLAQACEERFEAEIIIVPKVRVVFPFKKRRHRTVAEKQRQDYNALRFDLLDELCIEFFLNPSRVDRRRTQDDS